MPLDDVSILGSITRSDPAGASLLLGTFGEGSGGIKI
jgi:hypothetical protein